MPRPHSIALAGLVIGLIIAYAAHEASSLIRGRKQQGRYAVVRIVPTVVEAAQGDDAAATEEVPVPNPSPEGVPSDQPEPIAAELTTTQHPSAYLPVVDQDDIQEDDKALIDGILRWLPPACRDHLERLVVRYGPEAQRGMATLSTIMVRGGMPREETIAILTHECGHIIDLAAIRGSPAAGASPFPDGGIPAYEDDPSVQFYRISWENTETLKADARPEDFASGYAKSDPWEDVAETFIARVLHRDALRSLAEKSPKLERKVQLIEQYFLPTDFAVPAAVDPRPRSVWDWTKEPHALAL